MVRCLAFVFSAVLVGACAPPESVEHRPFTVVGPADADATTPLPLIVLLHGYGANAEGQNLVFPFAHDVNARRFLYALPNGTTDLKGRRFWNATDACCDYDGLKTDDVKFVREVIAEVKAHHPVDPNRVFVIGHSNGGFMALRLACEAGDVIQAVVSVAGAAWFDPFYCPAGPRVRVLTVHSPADDTIGYQGGYTTLGPYPSSNATISAYATRNGCTGPRVPLGTSDFYGGPDNETQREAFTDCPPGGETERWTVDGAPHIAFFKPAWRAAVLDWLLLPR